MASARDRLRPGITLTSPLGVEFVAKWRGDVRDLDFKLAVFSFPGVVGNVVQQLGAGSFQNPLTLYFDGPNHDKESNKFAQIMSSQTGTWGIIHPRYGYRELAPVRMRLHEQSIQTATYTKVDTEWIEPIDPVTLKTGAELAGTIENFADVVNQAAVAQFANNLSFDNLADRLSITNAVGKVQAIADKVLGPIAKANDAIFTSFNATQRGIQDIMTATILKPIALAGQIQNMLQSPALAIRDIKARLSAYKDLATGLADIKPSDDSASGRNTSAVQELSSVSTITTNSTVTARDPVSGGLRSRAQNVETAQTLNFQFDEIQRSMEASQEIFQESPIEFQFFAQTESYVETRKITALAVEHLLATSFNLQIEKRVVLTVPKNPAALVIEQLGDLGIDDSKLYDFVAYNNLRDTELIFIPAGREIVVYV